MNGAREAAAGRPGAIAEAITLLALAVLAAAVNWARLDPRLPLVADFTAYEFELAAPLVEAPDALALYEAGSHLFIDVRDVDADADPTIPGAFFVRVHRFDDDLAEHFDFIFPEDPLILYGEGERDLQTVSAVAARFKERDYVNVWILAGGFRAWRAAGGALSEPGGVE